MFEWQRLSSQLIGQTMLINLNASSPLTSAMLSPTEELQPDEALTSAAIKIGNFPADLAVGDSVRVVTVPDLAISESREPSMFSEVVIIYSIIQTTDNNDVALVTFRSSLDLSMTIARAGEVFVSRVSGISLQVLTSSSESGQ